MHVLKFFLINKLFRSNFYTSISLITFHKKSILSKFKTQPNIHTKYFPRKIEALVPKLSTLSQRQHQMYFRKTKGNVIRSEAFWTSDEFWHQQSIFTNICQGLPTENVQCLNLYPKQTETPRKCPNNVLSITLLKAELLSSTSTMNSQQKRKRKRKSSHSYSDHSERKKCSFLKL